MAREDRGARIASALEALAAPRARYDAALAGALERMREYIASRRTNAGDVSARVFGELGAFAAGRIDGERFAALFEERALAPDAAAMIERAAAAIAELQSYGDALFVAHVPTGGDLRRVVASALAESGRAFGAALTFQAARTGVRRTEWHERLLAGVPFAYWNRTERLLAPPLVVDVDGADLRAETLAEFLDGAVKIVLVVRGESPAAPLARLVTPGVFAVQAAEPSALAGFAAASVPGIAALLPATCALFAHDPTAGPALRDRLTVTHIPATPPRGAIGTHGTWQQKDELAQVVLLAELAKVQSAAAPQPAPARAESVTAAASSGTNVVSGGGPQAAAVPAKPASDEAAVDALASWLLAQAGLPADAAARGGTAA